MKFMENKIAIIGLGYVGLPLAVAFGKIRDTLGYDLNETRIHELKNGFDNTNEVSNSELLMAKRLNLTNSHQDLSDCKVFIITVPTPIDEARRPDLNPLINATKIVGKYLKKGDLVIYESTVYPGCTEEVCVPILERESRLTYKTEFYCGYSPERVNPGDKVNTLPNIVKITSGCTDETAIAVDALYNQIITAGTFKAASIKVAEAAKVIENTQRDLNIAFVNELSIIFDHLSIDTMDVLEAAGSKWNFLQFKPGIVGGHCIGVDPYYLTHKAEQVGYAPQVILAGRKINDSMARYIARKIIKMMISNNIDVTSSKVAILGVTFKENCPDIRNSKVIDIISELREWNIDCVVADPWANPIEVQQEYGIQIVKTHDKRKFDALIVAVGHDEYRNLTPDDLKNLCKLDNPIIGDLKSIYNKQKLNELGFSVFRL